MGKRGRKARAPAAVALEGEELESMARCLLDSCLKGGRDSAWWAPVLFRAAEIAASVSRVDAEEGIVFATERKPFPPGEGKHLEPEPPPSPPDWVGVDPMNYPDAAPAPAEAVADDPEFQDGAAVPGEEKGWADL